MNEAESFTALILAGGKSSRLKKGDREEFKLWPKPLVRLAGSGSETLIDTAMAGLRDKASVKKFIFLTGKDPEAQEELVQAHIKAFYGESGNKIRARVSFVSENTPLGTAGATNLGLRNIEDESIIVSPADTLFPYEELLNIPSNHPGRDTIIWMATSRIRGGEQNIGKLLCDQQTGQIKYVLEGENPSTPTAQEKVGLSALTSGGVLLVNRSFYLKMYKEYLRIHPEKTGKRVGLYGEFIKWLVESGKRVYAFDVKGPVMDLGRPEAFGKLR